MVQWFQMVNQFCSSFLIYSRFRNILESACIGKNQVNSQVRHIYIVTKVDHDILLMYLNGNRNLKNGQFGVISRKNKNFGRSIVKCDEIHQISF